MYSVFDRIWLLDFDQNSKIVIMGADSRELDRWRGYFRTADFGIVDVIEKAITVAVEDCPELLRARRDRIAELLYSCGGMNARCARCDESSNDLVVAMTSSGEDEGNGVVMGFKGEAEDGREGKLSSNRDDLAVLKMNQQIVSYEEAEALTDLIDGERQIVDEVFRIKDTLENFTNESESVLFDLLIRLQRMEINVGILRATEIGKAVNSFTKCESKRIRQLAKRLIGGWRLMVDEWLKTSQPFTENATEAMNPSIDDDVVGLSFPPVGEVAFITSHNTNISQILDDIDDNGNLLNTGGESNTSHECGKRPEPQMDVVKEREQTLTKGTVRSKDTRCPQIRKQDAIPKPIKSANAQIGPGRPVKLSGVQKNDSDAKDPSRPHQSVSQRRSTPQNAQSVPGRPVKLRIVQKVDNEVKVLPKSDKPAIQRRPTPQTEKLRGPDEDPVKLKLDASKRKLQESYQQVQNAKRQRTVQVMDATDIPKQGLAQKKATRKVGTGSIRQRLSALR